MTKSLTTRSLKPTIDATQRKKIAAYLKGRHIPQGLGNAEEAGTLAAINIAMTGIVTDAIPPCMSPMVGRWIIRIQDAMPDNMRNSQEWRELIPWAAGTGREHETERRALVMDWMWGTVLVQLQPLADKRGFGEEWKAMTTERTAIAAKKAAAAAYAAYDAADAAAADAAYDAAYAADAAAYAAAAYAAAAYDAAYAADDAAYAAAYAAAVRKTFWVTINPPALLRSLILVSAA